jgi:hypothetical protein
MSHYLGTRATKTKYRRDERAWKKSEECGQDVSLFRLTQIGCSVFWWTEASISCSNLTAAATYKHADSALSPTHRQFMGGGGKLLETNKYTPDAPGLVALEDPRAGTYHLDTSGTL